MNYTLTATVAGCAVSVQVTVDVDVNLNPVADGVRIEQYVLENKHNLEEAQPLRLPSGQTINGVYGILQTVP
ncbi:MAG: hypothetical protein R2774_14865 [Saprospiraceae bacterium]